MRQGESLTSPLHREVLTLCRKGPWRSQQGRNSLSFHYPTQHAPCGSHSPALPDDKSVCLLPPAPACGPSQSCLWGAPDHTFEPPVMLGVAEAAQFGFTLMPLGFGEKIATDRSGPSRIWEMALELSPKKKNNTNVGPVSEGA